MKFIKKQAIVVAAALVLILSVSLVVSAQVPAPEYIYFEVADGFPSTRGEVIMVNYDRIINDSKYTKDERDGLYKLLQSGIRSALLGEKNVWVEVNSKVYLYSDALKDGKGYSEALVGQYETNRPKVTYEVYFDGGRKLREPDPDEFKPLKVPEWFDSSTSIYEAISKSYYVTVTLKEDPLPKDGKLANIKLRYISPEGNKVYASVISGTDYKNWLFVIPADEKPDLDSGKVVFKPGQLEVMVGLNWYNYSE